MGTYCSLPRWLVAVSFVAVAASMLAAAASAGEKPAVETGQALSSGDVMRDMRASARFGVDGVSVALRSRRAGGC